ncbi:E3 ubiquitin-protein ligase TRIM35-like [Salmo salar]|uniref:E3 ubiquitin-protein ligase TRIM35-like n=1 Tax=Salmo salar TaxID=8030 RepID=A0ABM3CZN3_SALSA|nr:E3 ubiquitin-protein ligase TRIM35-like [Salmo salar]|eukprot:XP_014001831.1 PREDICTED: tripartite motif-containing protein 35-like [Salmo salar]
MATPVPVHELLLDTLDSLVSSELKRFQYLLTKNMLDGRFPIPKGCLENAGREDTVEKMVNAYSHEGAVKISLKILRKMDQNDLAMKLETGTLEKVPALKKTAFDQKEELKSNLESLRKNQETYKSMEVHIKKQRADAERQMREQFEKFHQFLREEEEARLVMLREEEEQKGKAIAREMERILKQISSLEQDLQKDDRTFLMSYKYTQNSTLPGTQQVSGGLIDMAKHLGNLKFRMWEKMKEIVQYTPVILNPNTANRWLSVSDNLTSVRFNNIGQQITDNPERFAQYAKVLGSEGFSSGKHIWEVEVGDHPEWNLGVAKETIDRKGEILASPGYGIWAILNRNGVYQSGKGEPLAFEKLKRIRVQLDFTSGEVSFYDPKDMTHIYTHKDTFAERLYPYFLVGLAGGANNPDIHICQSEVSLTVMASQ